MKTINTLELRNLIREENRDYVLIDIREKSELVNGMIPSSQHIFLSELKKCIRFI